MLQVFVLRLGDTAVVFELPKRQLQLLQPRCARPDRLPQARRADEGRVDMRLLREHGHGKAALAMDDAQVWFVQTEGKPQQSRLSGAVGPHQSDPIAVGDRSIDMIEDGEVADLAVDALQAEDRHQAISPERAAEVPAGAASAPERAAEVPAGAASAPEP